MSGNTLKAGWLWEDLQSASERVKTLSGERTQQGYRTATNVDDHRNAPQPASDNVFQSPGTAGSVQNN